jgi:hypothetical protein
MFRELLNGLLYIDNFGSKKLIIDVTNNRGGDPCVGQAIAQVRKFLCIRFFIYYILVYFQRYKNTACSIRRTQHS